MSNLMYSQGAVDKIRAEYEAQVARLIAERDAIAAERDAIAAERDRIIEEYTSPARDRRATDHT